MAVARINRRGRAMWRARICIGGRQLTAFRSTKAEALDAEAELRRRAKLPEKKGGMAPTYAEFWPRVVQHCTTSTDRPWRPGTQRQREICHARVLPHIGDVRLDRITHERLDRLVGILRGEYADETVASTIATVRLALGLARRWGIIDAVPDVRARKPPPSKIGPDEWLTESELQRLLAALPDEWRAPVLVQARTGLRVGELQALRWSDVDLRRRVLEVSRTYDRLRREFGPPKSGKTREVPIPPDAAAVLVGQVADSSLVFGTDEPMTLSRYDAALRRGLDGAGLESKRSGSHVLRHTWASSCVLAGIPSRFIMAAGGWASEAMLGRYAHLRADDTRSAFDRLAGAPQCDHGETDARDRGATAPLLQ